MTTVKMIDDLFCAFAPKSLSEEWDNDGVMLCGDLNAEVKMAIVCLDLTKSAVDYCINKGANLIITHHPYIFKPITHIDGDEYAILSKLINNNISILSYHTRLDTADGGVNDTLAKVLGLEDIKRLDEPYTQMARIGKFGARISPQSFAKHLIEKLDCKNIRASFADKDIQTVALVGGSGKDFLEDAYNCGADAFVTSEIPHHIYYAAKQMGISVYDCGHYYTENVVVKKIVQILKENFENLPCEEFDVGSPYVCIN